MNLEVLADFRVIDESEDWIVVDKPAPLIVHPANNKPEPTLLGGLERLLAYEIRNGATLGIVTRLDRETSGVVLVAKHKEAARQLGGIMERREALKEYVAIVRGWPEADSWVCRQPIARAGTLVPSNIWVRQMVNPMGRECRTRFLVERRFQRDDGRFSIVRCFPETGRMHQIRVHLASAGLPIVGDKLYSGDGSEYLSWMIEGWTDPLKKSLLLRRHALHSVSLVIPWSGTFLKWNSPMTADMEDFCDGRAISRNPDVVTWNRLE